MTEELFSVRGEVTGTGVYSLNSDLFHAPVTVLRIPAGMRVKVWCKRIAGEPADVDIEYTTDITVSPPVWRKVDSQRLPTSGEITLEKRRPLVLRGLTGREAVRVSRVAGTGSSYIDLELELTDE